MSECKTCIHEQVCEKAKHVENYRIKGCKEYKEIQTPTCRDCLHVDVCKKWAWDAFGADTQFPYKEPCEYFKPRTQFIELPCKVGDMVYALWSVPTETKYIVYCAEVKKISQYKKYLRLTTVFEIEPIEFRGRRKEYQIDDFGKLVFLTKEEAEKALERSEGK